jgi:hypothetical protein
MERWPLEPGVLPQPHRKHTSFLRLPVAGSSTWRTLWPRAQCHQEPGGAGAGNLLGTLATFALAGTLVFWKAYLSIKQPLTAHDPIHPQVSSRHDPRAGTLDAAIKALAARLLGGRGRWRRC